MAEVHEPPPCIQQPAPPWQRRRSYTAAATPASRHSDAGGVPGAKTKARPTSIQSVWVPVVRWRYVSMQCTKTTSPARMSKKTHHHEGTRLPADIRGLTAASAPCSWAHGLSSLPARPGARPPVAGRRFLIFERLRFRAILPPARHPTDAGGVQRQEGWARNWELVPLIGRRGGVPGRTQAGQRRQALALGSGDGERDACVVQCRGVGAPSRGARLPT